LQRRSNGFDRLRQRFRIVQDKEVVLSPNGSPYRASAQRAVGSAQGLAPVERITQTIETNGLFSRPILVGAAFSLTGAPLSLRIYKIYTPLSTGFVENICTVRRPAPRKPLRDAVLRGASPFPQ
jgi:hypothetical protein